MTNMEKQTDSATMHGRTVAVAGATGGVGEGVTRALLAHGAHVIAIGRDTDRLHDLTARLGESPSGRLTALTCDVTDPDSQGVTEQVRGAAGGAIDGVIISIGVSGSPQRGTVLDLQDDEVRTMVEVNEIGGWRALRALVPAVRPTGAVVNLMGASAEIPFPHNPLMGSTNAAIRSLVTTLADQLGDTGPRVYALVIGMVRTRARQQAGIDNVHWLRGEQIGDFAADLLLGAVPRPRQALRYLLDPAIGPQVVSPLLSAHDGSSH